MLQHLFPPLSRTTTLSPLAILTLSDLQLVLLFVSTCLMLWDWTGSLSKELRLGWSIDSRSRGAGRIVGRGRWTPGAGVVRGCFLASRYSAMLHASAVVTLLIFGRRSAAACNASRYLPYGFTAVSFLAHVVMALRIYRLFDRSGKVLAFLGVLALLDAAVQGFADGFVRPTLIPLVSTIAEPVSFVCYISPSSNLFSLTFLSPTIYHHLILVLTLYASWKHAQVEQTLGKGRSVMAVLRREQAIYVLGICLINFANVVLVLQPHVEYRMINLLPSLCFTQIFLGRIHFALRAFLDTRSRSSQATALPTLQFLTNEGDARSPGWRGSISRASRRKSASISFGGERRGGVGEAFEMRGLRLSAGDQLLSIGGGGGRYSPSPDTPQSEYSTYTLDSPGLPPPSEGEFFASRRDPHPSPPLEDSYFPPTIVHTSARRSSLSVCSTARRASLSSSERPPPLTRNESLPPLTSLPPKIKPFRASLPSISVLHERDEAEEEEGRDPTPPASPGFLAPPNSPESPQKARSTPRRARAASVPPVEAWDPFAATPPFTASPPPPAQEAPHPRQQPSWTTYEPPHPRGERHHRRTSREHWTPPPTWETDVEMARAGVEERRGWGNPFVLEGDEGDEQGEEEQKEEGKGAKQE